MKALIADVQQYGMEPPKAIRVLEERQGGM